MKRAAPDSFFLIVSGLIDGSPWLSLLLVFAVGAVVASFLNVCIYRLPLEKSILWPSRSYCGSCYQAIRWYDNVPLLSYWALGGRCRVCGARFSSRYFWVELGTALGMAALFYFDVLRNGEQLAPAVLGPHRFLSARLVFFGFHAVLFCFLIVAALADFDHQVIPLPLTVTGTIVGLIFATVWPWPWPYTVREVAQGFVPSGGGWGAHLRPALYPWPVWWPLPRFLQPGGNWRTGLATAGAGLVAGTLLLRAVRFLFGIGMGAEYMDPEPSVAGAVPWWGRRWLSWVQRVGGRVLGLGDADLMMMAGCFLGWQAVLVAFVIGTFAGLVTGAAQMAVRGGRAVAFGPGLAVGVGVTALAWVRIGPRLELLFFDRTILLVLAGVCGFLMAVGGYAIRVIRLARS